ncbi:unnamed protein product, partial [Urochloa humidicola]
VHPWAARRRRRDLQDPPGERRGSGPERPREVHLEGGEAALPVTSEIRLEDGEAAAPGDPEVHLEGGEAAA